MNITYLKGDATTPTATGNKIIVHICNDIGADKILESARFNQ